MRGKWWCRDLPAIATALTTVWPGGYDRQLSYGALGLWMEANRYRFAGQAREVVLEALMPERLHEAMVEIQFPVEKIDSVHVNCCLEPGKCMIRRGQ